MCNKQYDLLDWLEIECPNCNSDKIEGRKMVTFEASETEWDTIQCPSCKKYFCPECGDTMEFGTAPIISKASLKVALRKLEKMDYEADLTVDDLLFKLIKQARKGGI